MTAPDWRPASPAAVARRRARMLADARAFFKERAVLEVDTPVLSRTTVSDPQIESITATLARKPQALYFLQTSPEYFMKRLLAAGYPDIFQVARVFRDGEAGRRHSPEFTLVEWYRRGYGLPRIMDETVHFISALLEPGILKAPPAFVEYYAAVSKYANVDAQHATLTALTRAANADQQMIDSLGEERDAWLDLILSLGVVPQFPRERLTVLYHYPASQAALAQLCPDNEAVADRFEIFLGDLELANGFVELRDADEQLQRFEKDRHARRQRRQPERPADERFLAALRAGLPECAGVAVGFERLLMVNERTDDIRTIQTFDFDEDT